MYPASATGRLRCPENGGVISCSLAGLFGQGAWSGPARSYASAIVGCCPGTTGPAVDPCRGPGAGESAGTRVVHVPYVVEQDEEGVWFASAQLRPGVWAVGDGPTAEAAVADLRDALEALLAEVGPPDELTLTLDVA